VVTSITERREFASERIAHGRLTFEQADEVVVVEERPMGLLDRT
jgi:hypothetical protein